jgi:hypothetical protein
MTDRRQRADPVAVERRSLEKFPCPNCQSQFSVVVRPTWTGDSIRRVRECRSCHQRYYTVETFTRVLNPKSAA